MAKGFLGHGQFLAIRATGLPSRVDVRRAAGDVAMTTYLNPTSNAIVIVAINSNTSSSTLPVYISGSAPCMLNPWETSASKNLAQGTAIAVSNSRVSLTLAAQSVTTFVGMP